MTQNKMRMRRIFLLLIIILLASIAYLALQYSAYYEGAYQTVQGQKHRTEQNSLKEFDEILPERHVDGEYDLDIIREGRLFFKEIKEEPTVSIPTPVQPSDPFPQVQLPVEPQKPTCPYVLTGILVGEQSKAILVNKQNQISQTVYVGMKLGEFEVVHIEKTYVIIESPNAEFKLELGGM